VQAGGRCSAALFSANNTLRLLPTADSAHMGSRGGAASSPSAPSGAMAWVQSARVLVNRVVFGMDEEQEARMRQYLDETYGSSERETRRSRPVQLGSLRRVPCAAPVACLLTAPRRPPEPASREVPPPTSLDEEVARRLYEQLHAETRNAKETAAAPRAGPKARTPCLGPQGSLAPARIVSAGGCEGGRGVRQ